MMNQGVLLLNATFEPLRVVTLERAFRLILKDKVEIVENRDKILHSQRVNFPCPSILKLRNYVNVPKRNAIWSTRGVHVRDDFTCQYCGTKLERHLCTIDHIVPKVAHKKGDNPNTWGNTTTACAKCNRRKGGRSMHDAGMKFFNPAYEPRVPRVNYLVMAREIEPAWRIYLEV